MNRPTIEQQIDNSIDSFFDAPEIDPGENQLVFASSSSLSKAAEQDVSAHPGDTLVKVLKTTFIFLPGTFFLYFSSVFFLHAFFIAKLSMLDFAFGIFLWLVSALMTMFGIGELHSRRSLYVPGSICGIAFAIFLVSLLFSEAAQIAVLFEYSAYLFPLVLITPYVTKKFIDKTAGASDEE